MKRSRKDVDWDSQEERRKREELLLGAISHVAESFGEIAHAQVATVNILRGLVAMFERFMVVALQRDGFEPSQIDQILGRTPPADPGSSSSR